MVTRIGDVIIKLVDGRWSASFPFMNAIATLSWKPGEQIKIDSVETWEEKNAKAEA